MKKKRLIAFAFMFLALTMITVAPSFAAKKEFFAIATGGTGGAYYPLGGILAQALTDKVPDIIVTAQAGNASVANCNLIGNHQIESAFIQNNIAYDAYNGLGSFKGKPVKNLRIIASLYPETIQIVGRADAGIKTIADIKGKRLIPGDKGSGTEIDCINVLDGLGLSYKDFSGVDWLGFSGASQRLKDKQADVTFTTAGWPTAAITEIAMTSDITLVPLDEKTISALLKKYPFYARIVIPKGTYRGMDKDVPTITTMAQWAVDADVPDDVVYKLTYALWEKGKFVLRKKGEAADDAPSGAEMMAAIHNTAKQVQLKTALEGVGAVPLHPGAAKFYREKGMIK
jgi:TRAP transporter TAXI family solute receptor